MMKLLGIAALAATTAAFIPMLPDLKRYMKIESM
jgi:hypothetical protein